MNYQDEAYTEKIQLFISGQMPDEERIEFEQLLDSDDALREEVEFQRGLTQYIQDEGASQIQDRVKRIREMQENTTSFPWRKAVAAIFIIGILCVSALYLLSNRSPDPIYLSKKYFTRYPDRITQMGSDKDSLGMAMGLYNTGKYERAIEILELIPTDTSGYVALYLSLSQFQTDRTGDAVTVLKRVRGKLGENNNLKPVTQWYLILALLKDKKVDQARNELKQYFDKGYRYNFDKAQELAEELGVSY